MTECLNYKVRALDFNEQTKTCYLGTFSSDIYSIKGFPDLVEIKKVMSGHYSPNLKWTNEIWGLCTSHIRNVYYSVSDDSTMREYSLDANKMLRLFNLNIDQQGTILRPDPITKDLQLKSKARSVDINVDDSIIAVGFYEGTI